MGRGFSPPQFLGRGQEIQAKLQPGKSNPLHSGYLRALPNPSLAKTRLLVGHFYGLIT